MRALTDHEKRTVRLGMIGLAAYLVLFGGLQAVKFGERKRAEYRHLVQEAENLRRRVQIYDEKAAALKKLMETFQLDPATLSRTTAVAQASAAIQRAAASGGLQVGPVRESPGRPANKELGSLQLEATGPVPGVTSLLSLLETVGFPVIVESVQFTPDAARPGQVKLNLTVVILDFDEWKKGEAPHA